MAREYVRVRQNIICHEIGFIYKTQREAADDLKISYYRLNYYFTKLYSLKPVADVDGYTFDYTDEEP